MRHIFFNKKLNEYTMKEEVDGVASDNPKPVKFTANDRLAKYRRQAKR